MSNIGMFELEYYPGEATEEMQNGEFATYNLIEDALANDNYEYALWIRNQIDKALGHYTKETYARWAP